MKLLIFNVTIVLMYTTKNYSSI